MALGLRCARETTLKLMLALILYLIHATSGDMQGVTDWKTQFDQFKKTFKAMATAQGPAIAHIVQLPASWQDLRLHQPQLFAKAYADDAAGPSACQVDVTQVHKFAAQYKCRNAVDMGSRFSPTSTALVPHGGGADSGSMAMMQQMFAFMQQSQKEMLAALMPHANQDSIPITFSRRASETGAVKMLKGAMTPHGPAFGNMAGFFGAGGGAGAAGEQLGGIGARGAMGGQGAFEAAHGATPEGVGLEMLGDRPQEIEEVGDDHHLEDGAGGEAVEIDDQVEEDVGAAKGKATAGDGDEGAVGLGGAKGKATAVGQSADQIMQAYSRSAAPRPHFKTEGAPGGRRQPRSLLKTWVIFYLSSHGTPRGDPPRGDPSRFARGPAVQSSQNGGGENGGEEAADTADIAEHGGECCGCGGCCGCDGGYGCDEEGYGCEKGCGGSYAERCAEEARPPDEKFQGCGRCGCDASEGAEDGKCCEALQPGASQACYVAVTDSPGDHSGHGGACSGLRRVHEAR